MGDAFDDRRAGVRNHSASGDLRTHRSWAQAFALVALRFYKTYLSMLMSGSCRFEPTCSTYASQAIERFGAARGSWLALKRLLRCQPLSGKFGYDPVPDAVQGNGAARTEEAHS